MESEDWYHVQSQTSVDVASRKRCTLALEQRLEAIREPTGDKTQAALTKGGMETGEAGWKVVVIVDGEKRHF